MRVLSLYLKLEGTADAHLRWAEPNQVVCLARNDVQFRRFRDALVLPVPVGIGHDAELVVRVGDRVDRAAAGSSPEMEGDNGAGIEGSVRDPRHVGHVIDAVAPEALPGVEQHFLRDPVVIGEGDRLAVRACGLDVSGTV